MKKFLSMVLAATILVNMAACGDKTDNKPSAGSEVPVDLSGQWKQVNSATQDSYHGAIISGDKIEIYWVSNNGDTRSLYWAGSFVAPDMAEEPYVWDSVNDTEKTSSAILASSDASKTFTYQDDQIVYSASIMGSTTKVRLEKMEWEPGLTISESTPSSTEKVPSSESSQGGFNEATNFTFSIGGVEFSIPDYYKEEESTKDQVSFVVEGSDRGYAGLMIGIEPFSGTQEEFNKATDKEFQDEFETLSEIRDTSIAGLFGRSYVIHETYNIDMNVYLSAVYNINEGTKLMIGLMTVAGQERGFVDDYNKILATAKLTTRTSTNTPASGIRPEFKAAMDSYEEFFDRYIEFMQNFNSSNNTLGMLADYMRFMEEYAETMEAMEALDDGSLSAEETAYYLEVSNRINQKLLKTLQ